MYQVSYQEISKGYICFEADSIEEAKEIAEGLRSNNLTEGEVRGCYRNERIYEIAVDTTPHELIEMEGIHNGNDNK